jgi:hypothetical protein
MDLIVDSDDLAEFTSKMRTIAKGVLKDGYGPHRFNVCTRVCAVLSMPICCGGCFILSILSRIVLCPLCLCVGQQFLYSNFQCGNTSYNYKTDECIKCCIICTFHRQYLPMDNIDWEIDIEYAKPGVLDDLVAAMMEIEEIYRTSNVTVQYLLNEHIIGPMTDRKVPANEALVVLEEFRAKITSIVDNLKPKPMIPPMVIKAKQEASLSFEQ